VIALGLVAGEGALDDCQSGVRGPDFFDIDLFAFEQLVVLEEAAEYQQAVRREVARLDVAAEFRVAGGDCNDFVVAGPWTSGQWRAP
jgi:hypothetical protein